VTNVFDCNKIRLREDKLWVAARSGSVAEFELVTGSPQDPKVDVMVRGAFGETILHVACLFANFPVAKYIAKNFPALLNLGYEKDEYHGETVLHIAIVHADIDMVQYLLDLGAEVNDVNCDGNFFHPPKGKIYMGEHPLTFAACVDAYETVKENGEEVQKFKNKQLVRMLLKAGAKFDNQDAFGNTILHVLVIHGKIEMFHYIMDLYNLHNSPGDVRLDLIRNKANRTPLCLSAALAKGEVFEGIMTRNKETLWVFGPMAARAYPLGEIDTYHDPAKKPRVSTALELVVYLSGVWGNTDDSTLDRADLLAKTPIRELVDSKWKLYIRNYFFIWLFLYAVYLLIFSMVIVRPPYLFPDGVRTPALEGLEIVVLIYALLSLFVEIRDILTIRKRYFTEKGSRFFFMLAWCNSILVILAFIFRLTEDLASEELCTSLCGITTWFYALYFFRGFKSYGFFIVSIQEIIVRDLSRFISIFFVIACGFCLAFMTLYRRMAVPTFNEFDQGLLSMFLMMTNDVGVIDFVDTNNYALTVCLVIIYIFVVSILLLNMLIGMMGTTYGNVREASEKQYRLEVRSPRLTFLFHSSADPLPFHSGCPLFF